MDLTSYEMETVKRLQQHLRQISKDLSVLRITEVRIEATLTNGDDVSIGYGKAGGPALLWASRSGG